ncbi:TetR/AcrR family transcriptional regulator [Mycobacterium sp. M26]|uniref:TetR/AcrR family transcriptional regulator n=1 Tax=Mycobacterium sp. M26 TaxID=1762962 RepID=UPI00073E818C|nr:TetR/AcrR family transcriptional regulator [Mycobacterium sp. M26]
MPSITRGPQAPVRTTPEARADRRRDLSRRLLAATEALMRDGASFTELSVERLAVAAGTSRATFYVYFKDKSRLLEEFAEQVLDDIAAAVQGLWSQRDAAPADMRRAISDMIAAYRRHQEVLGAIMEVAHYTPAIDTAYRQLIDRNARYSRDFLDREIAAGRIRAVDSDSLGRVITWMVERCCYQMLRDNAPDAEDRLADALTEMIWSAIYLEAPR